LWGVAVAGLFTPRLAPEAGWWILAGLAVLGALLGAAGRLPAEALKRSGLAISLTGPWPPYNFISVR